MSSKRVDEIRARLAALPCKSWVWDGYSLLSEQGNGVVCDFGDDKDPHPKAVTKWIEYAPEDVAYLLAELDRAEKVVEAARQLAANTTFCGHDFGLQRALLEYDQ